MSPTPIAHYRLRRQGLSHTSFATPADMVGWLGAMQSQEYAPAKWSIGQRAAGFHDPAIEQALAEGRILRIHALRPTWHFVRPEDIRWKLALTAPRVHSLDTSEQKALEAAVERYGQFVGLPATWQEEQPA